MDQKLHKICQKLETSIPWAVRLGWLKMPVHAIFRREILTSKVGQIDLFLV